MRVDEDRLYGLMEIVERQQAAVQVALDGLAAERAALAQERETLAQAVSLAVAEGFAGAAGQGVEAVQIATQPLLGKLEGVTDSAARAEAALRRVVSWASWRLLGWIMLLIVAWVVFGWVTGNGIVWWDARTINRLQDQISALQANHDSWVKAGMLDRLSRCGSDNRPCVEVNEDAGAFGTPGSPSDYRVLKGY